MLESHHSPEIKKQFSPPTTANCSVKQKSKIWNSGHWVYCRIKICWRDAFSSKIVAFLVTIDFWHCVGDLFYPDFFGRSLWKWDTLPKTNLPPRRRVGVWWFSCCRFGCQVWVLRRVLFFFQDLVFDVVSSKKNSLLDCFVDVHLSFCTTSLPG